MHHEIFSEHLTVEALKYKLREMDSLLAAAGNAGLLPLSCRYDFSVNLKTTTPDEYKRTGKGRVIEHGCAATPFGECCIAIAEEGICALQFTDNNKNQILCEWKEAWQNTSFVENNRLAEAKINRLFLLKEGRTFNLLLKGTPFQLKVWETLLKIPFGKIISYSALARMAGTPGATRAVASAVARNPVGYVVPCHRVIRSEGVVGQYRWSPARKIALIGWEGAVQKVF